MFLPLWARRYAGGLNLNRCSFRGSHSTQLEGLHWQRRRMQETCSPISFLCARCIPIFGMHHPLRGLGACQHQRPVLLSNGAFKLVWNFLNPRRMGCRNRAASRDRIIDACWEDSDGPLVRNTLYGAFAAQRQQKTPTDSQEEEPPEEEPEPEPLRRHRQPAGAPCVRPGSACLRKRQLFGIMGNATNSERHHCGIGNCACNHHDAVVRTDRKVLLVLTM